MTKYLQDSSLWFLVASNLITIIIALVEGWSIGPLLWIYWAQSVIIGVFNFFRMMRLERFSVEGMRMNNRPVPPTISGRDSVAFFFLFHYGFFHFMYFIFLLAGSGLLDGEEMFSGRDVLLVLVAASLFFVNHLYSFAHNQSRDTRVLNLGTLMFYPYARIIPMHLTIIFGAFLNTAVLPFFLILKTGSDAVMHMTERHLREGPTE